MKNKKLGASPELRLLSKGTAEADESAANDMSCPDRPLTIEELQALNSSGHQAIQWVSQNETNKDSTDKEMDAIDNEMEDEEVD